MRRQIATVMHLGGQQYSEIISWDLNSLLTIYQELVAFVNEYKGNEA